MSKVIKQRNEILDENPCNFTESKIGDRLVMTVIKDKDGNATIEYRPEPKIIGTVEDYKLANLIELGIKLEHVTMMNSMSRENLKNYIEDFAKGHLEMINNNNDKEE